MVYARRAVLALLASVIIGCGSGGNGSNVSSSNSKSGQAVVLKVGASPTPHAKILEFISNDLKSSGIELRVVEISDYVTPNISLNDGSIDANFFQHKKYLDNAVKERGFSIVPVADVHIEPMGLYSNKITNLSQLKQGDTIAIPNDPANGGRALLLLQSNKIVKLKDPTNLVGNENDVEENPKNIKIKPLDSAILTKALDSTTACVINGNYAIQAGIAKEKLLIKEGKDSPYINVLAVRAGDENREEIKALVKALHSEKLREYIVREFKGQVIPAF